MSAASRIDDRVAFRRIIRDDGFLPLEDYGLIGDGATAALVGRDGAIDWLCAPRFDSPPLFARLLDRRAGAFRIAPHRAEESRHAYVPDTGVLVTEIAGSGGRVIIEDALALRGGAELEADVAAGVGVLVRRARACGHVELEIELDVNGGTETCPRASGLHIRSIAHPEINAQLWCGATIERLPTVITLRDGEVLDFVLRWGSEAHRHRPTDIERVWSSTLSAWRRWAALIEYDGPCREIVKRSVIGLKLLDHFENGAIVAAPTTSLPERIGGPRNWDYRYTWVRDAALSIYALRRVRCDREAAGFVGWVLDALERTDIPRALYDLDGAEPPPERVVSFEGYRGSRPVRFGNAASGQTQHDMYGEIIDCAFQGARIHPIDSAVWARLLRLADIAQERWNRPDRGIWEVRSAERRFTYSAALCHVALDRMACLARQYGLAGPVAAWRATADQIRAEILERAWDPSQQALCGTLEDTALDASILALPLRRVIPANDPRMLATVEAIQRHLGAGRGLLYRYRPDELVDGVDESAEGAFLLCSFWLVENLALQGRIDDALALFEGLCARAGHLGLFPEQIEPVSGTFLGNYPLALSHAGVIASGVVLGRAVRRARVRGD